MAINVNEWVQREWREPGVSLFRDKGDFWNLDTLMPSFDDRQLQRVPDWAAYAIAVDATNLYAIFLDEATRYVIYVGQDDSKLHAYRPLAMPQSFELTAAVSALGGLDTMNVLNWGGHLYIIGSDKDVYRSTGFTAAMSNFYGSADAYALIPHGDRVYLITDAGAVLKLKDDDSAFEALYTPLDTLDLLYATSFRGYLLLAAISDDGTLVFYRLTDSPTFDTLAQMPSISGLKYGWGATFAAFDDQIYFSPGYVALPSGDRRFDVYSFNGSQIELEATIPDVDSGADATGFLIWNDRLLFYEAADGATATYKIRMMLGRHFTNLTTLSTRVATVTPALASIQGEIYALADAATPTCGYHILQKSGTTDLQDGYLVTSYLDMSHPGKAKRLDSINVILDGNATDFKILLKYRVDDTAGWTTAATVNGSSVAQATAIAAEFTRLQVRIDLDDDSGNNEDIRIDAVSIIYSIGD